MDYKKVRRKKAKYLKNWCGWNENVKMDKCKYIKIFDLKWENSLKYRSIPYWWKYEGELFEMVQSCLDESDEYIDEKKWVDSHWEKKKMYRKIKIKNKKFTFLVE